jgi:hypothetical protein
MHSFIANAAALFVNPSSGDYRLKSGSPAINAGTSAGAPAADLDGRPRPAGGLFDIGAFEFGALFGDFNRDGKVDGGDYVIWRKTQGTTGTRYNGADGSGNGVVDQADYELWRAGFDAAAAGAGSATETGAVPEPQLMSMVFFVTWAVCVWRPLSCQ